MLTVRVTNGVDAVSGNAMLAPYQLLFNTAATSDGIPPAVVMQAPTNGAVVSGNLLISGTATDNVAVQKVEIWLDSGPWLTASGTTTWSYSLNTLQFPERAARGHARGRPTPPGRLSSNATASVRFFNLPGSYLQRMAGGNTNNVTDCSGNTWLSDQAYSFGSFGYSGGATGYLANTISGICTSAQSLYQRERYSTSSGGFYYQFDCPEGVYETTLLEAETYWSGAGQRTSSMSSSKAGRCSPISTSSPPPAERISHSPACLPTPSPTPNCKCSSRRSWTMPASPASRCARSAR